MPKKSMWIKIGIGLLLASLAGAANMYGIDLSDLCPSPAEEKAG